MTQFITRLGLLLLVFSTSTVADEGIETSGSLSLPALPAPLVAVSADGKRVLAPLRSRISSVRIHLESGAATPLAERAYNPAFTPDSKHMLSRGAFLEVKSGKRLRSLEGHEDTVYPSRFSMDCKYAVTGSKDKAVRVWDANTGKELAKLVGHDSSIRAVAMDAQNKLVISGSAGSTARIWDWKTGKTLHTLAGHRRFCRFVAFSKDSKRAITVENEGRARIWSTQTGEEIASLEVRQGINRIAINPNGNQIVTYNSLRDKQVRFWDWTGKLKHTLGHACPVQVVRFNADGSRVLTCSDEASMWDTATGKRLVRLEHARHIKYAQLHPDGKRMIGTSVPMIGHQTRQLVIWDIETGKPMKSIDVSDLLLRSLDISPDGENVIISGFQNRLAIWDLTTGEQSLVFQGGHAGQIWDAEFSPDGSRVATSSLDQSARLWDAKSGKLTAVLRGHKDRVQYITFSPSGNYIFTGSGPNNNTGRIWDAKTGKFVAELRGHTDKVLHARFSKDERRVLTGSDDNSARLWEVASGKELHRFKHGSTITTAEFSPDETSILTASSGRRSLYRTTTSGYRLNEGSAPSGEHSVKLWNAKTGELRADMEHPAGVKASFNSDGKQIVTVSQKEIAFWSAASGEKLHSKASPIGYAGTTVFSPDRQHLMLLTRGTPVELWNISARSKIRKLSIDKPSRSFFSHDGSTFYSLTRGGEFRSWSLDDVSASKK